jgi:hypothetical protein
MKVVIGNVNIIADGYIPIPEKNAIQFYREKSILDYIPPIRINTEMLTDFGKEIWQDEIDNRYRRQGL